MKQALSLLAISLLFVLPALSQGSWSIGVGPSVGIPSGDFNNSQNVGFGGLANLMYHFDQNFSAGIKTGYISFGGKDLPFAVSTDQGVVLGTVTVTDGIIPIVATGKYYFMPGDTRVFGALDMGLYYQSASATATASLNGETESSSASTSTSDFGISPAVGVAFKVGEKMNLDARLNYTSIFTSGSNTSWIGIDVDLEFGL